MSKFQRKLADKMGEKTMTISVKDYDQLKKERDELRTNLLSAVKTGIRLDNKLLIEEEAASEQNSKLWQTRKELQTLKDELRGLVKWIEKDTPYRLDSKLKELVK